MECSCVLGIEELLNTGQAKPQNNNIYIGPHRFKYFSPLSWDIDLVALQIIMMSIENSGRSGGGKFIQMRNRFVANKKIIYMQIQLWIKILLF